MEDALRVSGMLIMSQGTGMSRICPDKRRRRCQRVNGGAQSRHTSGSWWWPCFEATTKGAARLLPRKTIVWDSATTPGGRGFQFAPTFHFLLFRLWCLESKPTAVGGASGLVTGLVFKTIGRARERASVGFDSHTPPPSLSRQT